MILSFRRKCRAPWPAARPACRQADDRSHLLHLLPGLLPAVILAQAAAVHGPEAQTRRAPAQTAPARDLRDVLGVVHMSGAYHLTQQDFLNEGADKALALGTRVIKLDFHDPDRCYPYNTAWPRCRTLTDLAMTEPYRRAFGKPFTTFILTAYSLGRPDHHWIGGLSKEAADEEMRQFHDLARHLLTEYRDSGKTFVLQHWEGDWAVRGHYDRAKDPSPEALENMAAWLRARQEGVSRARAEVGQRGTCPPVGGRQVRVLHAAEVNLVEESMRTNRPGVVNKVLPHIAVDLVSYSCYDTQDDARRLRAAMEYIARHMAAGDGPAGRRVYVGEYGLPENVVGLKRVQETVKTVVDTSLEFGCPYVIYWQLYCNEPLRRPVVRNEDAKGFWLIKPDGSRSWSWGYLRERFGRA